MNYYFRESWRDVASHLGQIFAPRQDSRITSNFQITMPKVARDALRLKRGDFLEATVERGAVVLRPKVLRDRAESLKQLKKDNEASKADVAAGRVLGPFDNARDAERALRDFAKKKKRRAHARTAD